jgi:hypothetical protein
MSLAAIHEECSISTFWLLPRNQPLFREQAVVVNSQPIRTQRSVADKSTPSAPHDPTKKCMLRPEPRQHSTTCKHNTQNVGDTSTGPTNLGHWQHVMRYAECTGRIREGKG